VLHEAAFDHTLAAALAISLNAIAAALILVRPEWSLPWIGPGSVLLFGAYVAGTRVVYRNAVRDGVARSAAEASDDGPPSLKRAVIGFLAAALVVLLAAPGFAWAAKGIAEITGLGTTFVGTWLVGIATSLPELVTCVAAVRMGSFDLAVGNLFGSNAFNMAIFLALDMAHPGSLFAALDPSHALSGLFAIVLMSLGVAAIVYRAKPRFAMVEPDSLLILAAYVLGLWVLFQRATGS
jgi:cation:H+ antiporter